MKTLKRLAISLALVVVLAASAFAADFTHCADALKDLGLIQGTDSGYQLDRAPTRAEAAAMLVRLLGQETAAKALTYSAPFTDVPAWAQPYVQYLYDNGLTSGKTATTFVPGEPCTAQMYATFVLRALGYSDQTDGQFTYADALNFAAEKGVVNAYNCDVKNFLRDDMMAISYTALATAPRDGAETNLLQKLMKAGVIQDAKGYDKQFQAYDAYTKALDTDAAATKQHMKVDMSMDAKISGMELLVATMNMDMLIDLNPENLNASKMAMTGKIDMKMNPVLVPENNTIAGDMKYYYTDGNAYVDMAGTKMKMPMRFDEIQGLMDTMSQNSSTDPICMIDSISQSGSSFTVSYAGGVFTSMMEAVMDSMKTMPGMTATDIPEMQFKTMDVTVTITNGQLTKQVMDMGLSVTTAGRTVDMTMKMEMTNVAGTVNVELPTDLATYPAAEAAPQTPAA